MRIIKNLTLAGIAATLLFQTSMARGHDQGKRDEHGQPARATFTKYVTSYPNMAGVVGGDAGEGLFAGEVLMATPGPVTVIEALYHFHGLTHDFTALVHVEWTGVGPGSTATIIGVVTEGWLKGHAVKGEFTTIRCDHVGPSPDCFEGVLEIQRDSRD
jgi:hypothetical protein